VGCLADEGVDSESPGIFKIKIKRIFLGRSRGERMVEEDGRSGQ